MKKGLTYLLVFILLLTFVVTTVSSVSLPQTYLDTSMPPRTGQTINVNAGGNLQQAIDNAQPGDTIVLQAGTVFQTNSGFILRNKVNPQNKWITITSSAEALLPPEGQRISPSPVGFMPVIEATGGNPLALSAENGASFYRIIGIHFKPQSGKHSNTLVAIGSGSQTLSQLPHDIVLDRVLIMGDPAVGGTRGLALNGRRIGIINSYFDDWKVCGHDGGTAIGGWNSDGVFKIVNNQISAAGIGFIYGGASGPVQVVPADMEVRQNYFYKKSSWTSGAPCGSWPAKNSFELKVGKRVLVEGNVFNGNWLAAQYGPIILLKSDQQQNSWSPPPEVGHITFRHNLIYNTGSGIELVGYDDNSFGTPLNNLNNVLIENNIMHTVNVAPFTSTGARFLWFEGGGTMKSYSITVQHNTFIQDGSLLSSITLPSDGVSNLILRDNIFSRGQYGVFASCCAEGTATFNGGAPGSIVEKNVFIGASSGSYPQNNFYPSSSNIVGFTDLSNKNFLLLPTSLYKNAATDGKDIGANVALVNQMTAGAITGIWGNICTDTSWTPSTNTRCGTFTQISNCGNTRSASGSLTCGGNTPVCSSSNVCVQCTQSSQCGQGQSCVNNACINPGQIPSPGAGLIVAYNFSENTGITTTDYSGNGRTGTLTGTSWVPGKTGSGLNFNPTSASRVVTTDFAPPTSITMEAWIYPTDVADDRTVLSKSLAEYEMRIIGGLKRLQAGLGTARLRDYSIDFGNSANLNQWYHYAYTYDSLTGDAKLYRNGILINRSNFPSPNIVDSSYPLIIGRNTGEFGSFGGIIDDVRIWSFARTQSQIQNDMSDTLCVDTTWSPSLTTLCGVVTQVSDCGNTRLVTGKVQCNSGQTCANNICANISSGGDTTIPPVIPPSTGGGGSSIPTSRSPSIIQKKTIGQASPTLVNILRDFSPDTGIKRIEVMVIGETQNVGVTVSQYENLPEAVSVKKPGRVYKYLHIEPQNLSNNLESAIIKSQVEKSWIEENHLSKYDIALFKFNETSNKWMELPTTFIEEDETYYYYDTEVDSFSYFLIGQKATPLDVFGAKIVIALIILIIILSWILFLIVVRSRKHAIPHLPLIDNLDPSPYR